MTNIIHVIFKWEGGEKSNAVLFLPEYSANLGNIVCYAHVGQHSEACMGYYWGLHNPQEGEQMNEAKALFAEYMRNNPDDIFKVVKQDREKFRKERYAHV